MLNYRTVNAVFFPLLTIITLTRIFVFEIHWIIYPVLISLYLFLVIYGAFNISFNYYLNSVCHADTNEKQICLTFDDGPDEYLTPLILETLKKNNIKACFFVIGKKAILSPHIIRDMDNDGHIIGNHTYNHSDFFDFMPLKKMKNEITGTGDAVFSIIGKRPKFFRPPFGVTNPLVRIGVKKTDQISIGWSLRSYDTKITVGEKILKKFDTLKPGDIILFHDNKKITVEILQQVIDLCNAKGFKFVNLDEMIKTKAYV